MTDTPEHDPGDSPNPAKPWWDHPSFPWQGEPTRAERACWVAFGLLAIYGVVMLPLKPLLLKAGTHVLALVTGSTISMVDIGAGLQVGTEPRWWMFWLAASLAVMRFDWIFWWAGRLWGDGMIRVLSGRSRWSARTARTAEKFAERWGVPLLFFTWFIPFIPTAVICALVGAAKMRLRTFLLVDALGALLNRAFYLYLGFRIGEPAKDVVMAIAKYATWISLALLAWIVISSVRNSGRTRATAASTD